MLTAVLRIGHEREGLPIAPLTVHGLDLAAGDDTFVLVVREQRQAVARTFWPERPSALLPGAGWVWP
jgi:hypothetical protein